MVLVKLIAPLYILLAIGLTPPIAKWSWYMYSNMFDKQLYLPYYWNCCMIDWLVNWLFGDLMTWLMTWLVTWLMIWLVTWWSSIKEQGARHGLIVTVVHNVMNRHSNSPETQQYNVCYGCILRHYNTTRLNILTSFQATKSWHVYMFIHSPLITTNMTWEPHLIINSISYII